MLILASQYSEAADVAWGFYLFLLFLAALIPACIYTIFGAWNPILLLLAIAQGASIFFGLRWVSRGVRRRGYRDLSVGFIYFAAYFILCLASNALFVPLWFLLIHLGFVTRHI